MIGLFNGNHITELTEQAKDVAGQAKEKASGMYLTIIIIIILILINTLFWCFNRINRAS